MVIHGLDLGVQETSSQNRQETIQSNRKLPVARPHHLENQRLGADLVDPGSIDHKCHQHDKQQPQNRSKSYGKAIEIL